jgi:hypothetical protein
MIDLDKLRLTKKIGKLSQKEITATRRVIKETFVD